MMAAAPRTGLLLLTAGVLAAHLLLLQYAARGVRPGVTPSNKPFTTRLLTAPSAPAPAMASPPPPALAAAIAPPLAPAPATAPQAPPRRATRSAAAAAPSATEAPSAVVPAGLADSGGIAVPPPAEPASAPAAPVLAASSPAPAAPTAAMPQPAASASLAATPAIAPASAASAAAAAATADMQRLLLATRYSVPPPRRIGYNIAAEVKGIPWRANGELLWQHDGQAYTARLEIGAFLMGSRVQTSAGRITEHALAPTRFSDKVKSEVAAHFNEAQGKVTFSANSPDVPLQPMAQDRLSIFLQLAGMLAAEPAKYPPGSSIAMQAVGPRSAETWVFAIEQDEALNLPGGGLTARRLVHYPERDFDQKVELWLAPDKFYLPVRLRITQAGGDFVDLQWRTDEKP